MTKAKKPKAKPGTSKEAAVLRKKLFADAYINNGGNATQAAISAGYSTKTAYSLGGRLLKDVEVQARLKEHAESAAKISGLSVERTLREIARLAYSDPRNLYHPDGRLKAIHELDDDTAATIASVEADEIRAGETVIGSTRKLKQWDKNSALDKAMKFHGLYVEKHEHTGKDGAPLVPELSSEDIARRLAFILTKAAGA